MIYRQRRDYENLQRVNFEGAGRYGFPYIAPERMTAAELESKRLVGFNYINACKDPKTAGIHFFLDDYQFARLWTRPEAYLTHLRNYGFVCSPDFSMYTDFPKAIQIYNCFRNHWLAAFWQLHGIKVVPTVMWSDEESFDWCFDGCPEDATVAVSSVGTQRAAEPKRLFLAGYDEMIRRLHPSTILFYGSLPDECKADNVVVVRPFQDEVRRRTMKEDSVGR